MYLEANDGLIYYMYLTTSNGYHIATYGILDGG